MVESFIWGHEAGKESGKCRIGNLFKVARLNGEKHAVIWL